MPTKGAPTDRAIRQNPALINRPGAVSWIPAFACLQQVGRNDGGGKNDDEDCLCVSIPSIVIPAQARLQGCRW